MSRLSPGTLNARQVIAGMPIENPFTRAARGHDFKPR
jgi:hypothetical protein